LLKVSAHAEGHIVLDGASLVLTLADPSDVWTVGFPAPASPAIEVPPLVAGTDATIAWPGALPIVNGCVRIETGVQLPLFHGCAADYDDAVRIDATTNTLHFTVPNATTAHAQLMLDLVTQVELGGASGDKSLPRCDGPVSCDITGYGQRTLDVGIAP
jgi:hypothetical protein